MRLTRLGTDGFTLLELLIICLILGVLAVMAIPQFNEYRTKACNSAAVSDAKNIRTGFEAYAAENQVYPDDLALQ